jgi:carbamoyltransferase
VSGPIYILGINAFHGDVSAVLLRDGRLVVALEEERFTRVKHAAGFPTHAIRRCLETAGIDGAEVSHVAVSRDPRAHLLRKAAYVLRRRPSLALVRERLRNRGRVTDLRGPLAEALSLDVQKLPALHHVEHHPAHLASAFLVSPFDEAAVAALDGFGDFVSTSVAVGRGSRIEVLDRVHFPHSLGILYTAVTQHLGFLDYGDEFKVMGLAPYGSPSRVAEVEKLIRLLPGGRFELDLQYFRHWKEGAEMTWTEGYPTMGLVYAPAIERLLGPARRPDEPITRDHEDLAASLQSVYEHSAFHVLADLYQRTRLRQLCLAGGCAMNSVANGKIRTNTPFEEVYVQPAAADNGTALGAAFHTWHCVLGRPRSFVMEHAFWGTEWSDEDVMAVVAGWDDREWSYAARRTAGEDETCREAAGLLADGNVVGWFQGRMEWGARALGNRSILADPRRADMRDLINARIKFRERFRPFAPSILEERLDEYFEGARPDPFMQQVYPVRSDKCVVIPAVTHVDGSGRLQTVARAHNPRYYHLIEEFERLTGVPVLLNTSFNENEPIVHTPEQALDCFRRTRMDALVIGDVVVTRTPASNANGASHDIVASVSSSEHRSTS